MNEVEKKMVHVACLFISLGIKAPGNYLAAFKDVFELSKEYPALAPGMIFFENFLSTILQHIQHIFYGI